MNKILYQDELITKLEIKSKVYGAHDLILDTSDYPRVKMFKWSIHTNSKILYARSSLYNNNRILFHRLVMSFPNEIVDHKDHNGLNNLKTNLRICSAQQNSRNALSRKSNGLPKGVWVKRGKYIASICTNYKLKHLGVFNTAEEAGLAYNLAANDCFKEFASTT